MGCQMKIRSEGVGDPVMTRSGELTTVIYNHGLMRHDDFSCGETFIPPASQLRSKKANHHGRQIPESKPEEIHTETRQNQRQRRETQSVRGSQTSRRQEEISAFRSSLLN